jgi:hypothetical protein
MAADAASQIAVVPEAAEASSKTLEADLPGEAEDPKGPAAVLEQKKTSAPPPTQTTPEDGSGTAGTCTSTALESHAHAAGQPEGAHLGVSPSAASGSRSNVGSQPVLVELTKEERALRGLLQFYVCADARRQNSETASPLQMRYRELITVGYEVVSNIKEQLPKVVDPNTSGIETSPNGATSSSQIVSGSSMAEEDVATGCEQGDDDVLPPRSSSNSAAASKAKLKQQLLAKQKSLAKEMQRLRNKQQSVTSSTASVSAGDATAGASPSASDFASSSFATATDNRSVDVSGATMAAKPPPPPSRIVVTEGTREEREAALKRKWLDTMEATFETERLQAKKKALTELRTTLREELAKLKEERGKAVELALTRHNEEAAAVAQLRQALNFIEGPLPHISDKGDLVSS